eukprot:g75118.t1
MVVQLRILICKNCTDVINAELVPHSGLDVLYEGLMACIRPRCGQVFSWTLGSSHLLSPAASLGRRPGRRAARSIQRCFPLSGIPQRHLSSTTGAVEATETTETTEATETRETRETTEATSTSPTPKIDQNNFAFRPGDWFCPECKTQNFASRHRCRRCDKQKPSNHPDPLAAGDSKLVQLDEWVCPECNRSNSATRSFCRFCKKGKSVELLAGDWMCPACNCQNFPSRQRCYKCDKEKPSEAMKAASSSPKSLLEKKWKCRWCGYINAHFSWFCVTCQEPKPKQDTLREVLPGDWFCPECKNHNFASRLRCRLCDKKKPKKLPATEEDKEDKQDTAVANLVRPDDWVCPQCQFHNFASRHACRNCDARREIDDSGLRKAFREVKEGDWMCPKCKIHNFKFRKECRTCGTAREDQW